MAQQASRRNASLAVFIAVALGFAWILAIPLWREMLADPTTDASDPGALLWVVSPILMMTAPATAAVVALKIVEGESWRGVAGRLKLGLGNRPRQTVAIAIVAILAAAALCLLTVPVAWLLGGLEPDMTLSGMKMSLAAQTGTAPEDVAAWPILALQLASIPIAAVIPNGILALLEEVGWRGYLFDALTRWGAPVAYVGSGVIWGLWHAPVVLLGYNFDQANVFGLLLMIVGCVIVGALLCRLTVVTGSIWPAAVAHGAINAAAGIGLAVQSVGAAPELWVANPLGVSGWIVFGAALVLWAVLSTLGRRASPGNPRNPQAAV